MTKSLFDQLKDMKGFPKKKEDESTTTSESFLTHIKVYGGQIIANEKETAIYNQGLEDGISFLKSVGVDQEKVDKVLNKNWDIISWGQWREEAASAICNSNIISDITDIEEEN